MIAPEFSNVNLKSTKWKSLASLPKADSRKYQNQIIFPDDPAVLPEKIQLCRSAFDNVDAAKYAVPDVRTMGKVYAAWMYPVRAM